MPQNFIAYFLLGACGALASELLKLYELRGRLSTVKYVKLAHSPLFWVVSTGMILSSGFIAWAVNSGVPNATPLQVVLAGIGARGLVRGIGETGTANAPDNLGEDRITLRDILQ